MTISFTCGISPAVPKKGKITWRLSFLACSWTIWRERNRICSEGVVSPLEDIIHKMKFYVASWASFLPKFWGLSLDCNMYKWREIVLYDKGSTIIAEMRGDKASKIKDEEKGK